FAPKQLTRALIRKLQPILWAYQQHTHIPHLQQYVSAPLGVHPRLAPLPRLPFFPLPILAGLRDQNASVNRLTAHPPTLTAAVGEGWLSCPHCNGSNGGVLCPPPPSPPPPFITYKSNAPSIKRHIYNVTLHRK